MHYRGADPSKGEYIRPIAVEPPISIDLPAENFVFPSGAARDFSLQIRALSANQSGEVRLETPQGWKVTPATAPYQLKETGAAQTVSFRLTPSRGTTLRAVQSAGEGRGGRDIERCRRNSLLAYSGADRVHARRRKAVGGSAQGAGEARGLRDGLVRPGARRVASDGMPGGSSR